MKTGKIILILILTLFLTSCKGSAQEIKDKNPTSEYDFSTIEKFKNSKINGQIINDYDNVFNDAQEKELSDLLYNYELETTRQIVIVTVDNINLYSDTQKFAVDLGNYWGVGNSEKDNGLTIVLCKPCRQIGIATGLGTELILTNEICKKVIDKTIIPNFKNEEYFIGIKNGVTELIEEWK
ncbi:MAG: TPM domain-containing protein [Bacteroidota bacterium]